MSRVELTLRQAQPGAPRADWMGATRAASGPRDSPPSAPKTVRALEPLEFTILREWFAEDRPWLGIDPRKSPEAIAKRIGVSPATVRRHLVKWRSQGFHLGYDVLPHPALLGGRLAARIVDFADLTDQERALEAMCLIDGIVQIRPARARSLAVYLVEAESQVERRRLQLEQVDGVTTVGPELNFALPPCSHRVSRADWRLLMALRRRPEASLGELASALGQSSRTTARRYNALLDAGGLMFDPILDFSRFFQTLAILVTSVETPDLRDTIEQEIRSLHPLSIHSTGPSDSSSIAEDTTVCCCVSAPTAAELDGLAVRVARLPGVRDAWLWYGHSTLPVLPWLDERIETACRISGSPRSGAGPASPVENARSRE